MIAAQEPIAIGEVEINPKARSVFVSGQEIDLTEREFALLYYLMGRAGHVVSRDELNVIVWDGAVKPTSNTIDVSVCHVRTKIGDEARRVIRSIRGVGYFYAQR